MIYEVKTYRKWRDQTEFDEAQFDSDIIDVRQIRHIFIRNHGNDLGSPSGYADVTLADCHDSLRLYLDCELDYIKVVGTNALFEAWKAYVNERTNHEQGLRAYEAQNVPSHFFDVR